MLAGCGGGGTPVKLYKAEDFQSQAAYSRTIPVSYAEAERNSELPPIAEEQSTPPASRPR